MLHHDQITPPKEVLLTHELLIKQLQPLEFGKKSHFLSFFGNPQFGTDYVLGFLLNELFIANFVLQLNVNDIMAIKLK